MRQVLHMLVGGLQNFKYTREFCPTQEGQKTEMQKKETCFTQLVSFEAK